MFEYKITSNCPDSHQSSPFWLCAIVPFVNPSTFDVQYLFKSKDSKYRPWNLSNDEIAKNPTESDDIIVIDDDCIRWEISSSKEQHVSRCNLQLMYSEINYQSFVSSGDWLLFWGFDNEVDYKRVKKNVIEGGQCNNYNDGLKFMGRVDTIRKRKNRSADGLKTIMYSVTANGFTELDNSIFYNPRIMAQYKLEPQKWLLDIGGKYEPLFDPNNPSAVFDPTIIIPKLLKIFLGMDPNETFSQDSETEELLKVSAQRSPNKGYLIPKEVSMFMLGETNSNTYVDLLNVYVGLQKYSTDKESYSKSSIFKDYYPELSDLSSKFIKIPLIPSGQSVWSILKSYVNEPIDEMYTCLRVNEFKKIMPTLVVRQMPFTSDYFASNCGFETTPFTNLPRWSIEDNRIISIDYGTSDSLRLNYVFFQSQDLTGTAPAIQQNLTYGRNLYCSNPIDSAVNGLRMNVRAVGANFSESNYNNENSPGGRWQTLFADASMEGHMKCSGTITCKGIQEPICEGDNCVADGMLFHIQRISHSGSINLTGIKNWDTTLSVSDGISIEEQAVRPKYIFDLKQEP